MEERRRGGGRAMGAGGGGGGKEEKAHVEVLAVCDMEREALLSLLTICAAS